MVSATKTSESLFRLVAKNAHDFQVQLRLEDRLPVSEEESIQIEKLPEMTPPDTESPQGRRGVVIWHLPLKAGEEKTVTLAYRLRWPAAKPIEITPLEQ